MRERESEREERERKRESEREERERKREKEKCREGKRERGYQIQAQR